MRYHNKIVMITGAGSGMGRSYAMAFAKAGAHLALNDFNADSLEETVSKVKALYSVKVCSQAFDVADRVAMFAFADTVKSSLGLVDIVINNAGISAASQPTWALEYAAYQRVMNINFYGVLNGTQAFLPHLLAKGTGHIINVSSIFGLVGTPNNSAYCASKFAVRGFTESLMTELQDSNIKVHLLHPGGIDTNIGAGIEGADAFVNKYLTTSPDAMASFVMRHIQRGTPRMVYGNDSFKTWMGATFVPLRVLNKIIWSEMKRVIDMTPYQVLRKKT